MASFLRVLVRNVASGHQLPSTPAGIIVRTITSKTLRDLDKDAPKRPAPYNYHDKPFNWLHYLFDKTTSRFDDNSKILVVEGPLASGKSKFAKELATELDMLYMPEANQDMLNITSYGYDLRKLDLQLPESCRSVDVDTFLRTPTKAVAARFQLSQYIVRFSQYIDALAHVLSTGQGVVLDRCVYSDFVFAEAMYRQGWLSKAAYKKYYEFRDCTLGELLRPHLVLYLDVPVDKVQQNISQRAIGYEKNSPVLTKEFLTEMEKQYKQNYLKEINKHSELLVYDWSEEGDVEIVVEDIERIPFEYDCQDVKMRDWAGHTEEDWAILRNTYSDNKEHLMEYTGIPTYDVPELLVEGEEAEAYYDTMREVPGNRFREHYNADAGDTNLLFKVGQKHRDTLPLRDRRAPL